MPDATDEPTDEATGSRPAADPGGSDRQDEAGRGRAGRDRQTTGRSPHLGDDRRFFEEGRPGNLADQADLTDAEGDDIREYTGEPVETEDGWVIPQQQNVGPGNEAGGGEFPAEPGDPQELP